MATETATPPADAGNDLASLQETVRSLAATVTTPAGTQSALVKNVDTIAQTLTKLPPAPPASTASATAAGDGKPAPLTAADVAKIVSETMAGATKTNEAKAARDAYAGDKLKDLPSIYREKLGSDASKWATEEQSIREQFKADLKTAGVEPKQLGNANADGGTTPDKQPVDRSKMTPMDLLNSDAKTA